MAGLLALMVVLSHSDDAEALHGCTEACAYIAYGLVTIGGLATAAGSQITLLEGEPDATMGYASLGFAAANGAVGGVILLVSAGMAAFDEDAAPAVAAWGGLQMSIAIAGLVSGATVVANQDAPPGGGIRGAPTAASITIPF